MFWIWPSSHFKRDCPKTKKGASHNAKTAGKKSNPKSDNAYAGILSETWLVDSSASSHMTWNKQLLVNLQEV